MLSYSPTDCFENYPFPDESEELNNVGGEYIDVRSKMMVSEHQHHNALDGVLGQRDAIADRGRRVDGGPR
jgi:hypothetical protein